MIQLIVSSVVTLIAASAPPGAELGAAVVPAPTAWKVPQPELPRGPMVAAARFEQFGCSKCHSVGKGVDKIGPNLGKGSLRMTFFQGAATLWNHLPAMNREMRLTKLRQPAVTGADLIDLVGFFTTYQHYLTHIGKPGDPKLGRSLFKTKQCAQCHSLVPGQKSKGPNLSQFGGGQSVLKLAQAMWNHGPKMQATAEVELIQRPYFRGREMADLLAYLATSAVPAGSTTAYIEPGNPSRGATLFQTHRCTRCHAVRGVGGGAPTLQGEQPAPDLGRSDEIRVSDYTAIAALMWNHAVPMWDRMKRLQPDVVKFTGNDLADLVAYLFFMSFVDEPGQVDTGRAIYRETGCIKCHGDEGAAAFGSDNLTLATAPGLDSPWDFLAAMVRSAPGMRAEMTKRGLSWPKLDRDAVRHLLAYIAQIRAGN